MRGQGVVGARTDVSQGPDARTSAADESVALRSSSPPVSSNPEMSPVDSGGRLYLFLRTQPPRGTGAGACLRKPPHSMRPVSRRKPSYRERSIMREPTRTRTDQTTSMTFKTRELSSRTFPDFEELARQQGSCWCIYYQRPSPVERGRSAESREQRNRRDKAALVREGRSHAILVYEGNIAVGWCQYGRADELPRIDAGRGYRKVGRPKGAQRLWRITCFFVDRRHRGRGVAKLALKAALESIRAHGGGIVEAFPVVSKRMSAVPEWRWFGTPSMFRREGFRRIAPLGTSGIFMRKKIPSTGRES